MSDVTIFCIGHSTRPIRGFSSAAARQRCQDTRRHSDDPWLRRTPQFGRQALQGALGAIRYVHLAELGGLHRPSSDSPNRARRNEAFRGFADYMGTEAFAEGIRRLLDLAVEAGPVAIMYAEAVP